MPESNRDSIQTQTADSQVPTIQMYICRTYTVSQKTVQTYFLSKLCQISNDCKNFWQQDSRENKFFSGVLIFHLT